jgi:hypothetical protein
VAVRVVDGLEVIDVDECHRQGSLVAVRPLDLVEQLEQQRAAVGYAGQLVGRGGVGRLRERDRDPVDGPPQPTLEAAPLLLGPDGDVEVAFGELFGGPHEAAKPIRDVDEHEDGRQGDAHGGGGDRGHDWAKTLVEPRIERGRHADPKHDERDRGDDSQAREKTHHSSSLPVGPIGPDLTDVPATAIKSPARTVNGGAAPADDASAFHRRGTLRGPLVTAPVAAILRRSSTARGTRPHPGGRPLLEEGASFVP